MKDQRILNLLVIVTSLLGYLEWGGDNHTFLYQAEVEVLRKLFSDPASVVHPFILLPLTGQLLLVVTLYQREPRQLLTYTGIGCLALLFLFMFCIGMIALNSRVLLSTLPFLVAAFIAVQNSRKRVQSTNE